MNHVYVKFIKDQQFIEWYNWECGQWAIYLDCLPCEVNKMNNSYLLHPSSKWCN